jgi:uncharacterized protein
MDFMDALDASQEGPDEPEERIADAGLLPKYRGLVARLSALGAGGRGVAVGFSGGADSVLLTAVARRVLGRDRVVACLAVSPSLAAGEYAEAAETAALLDVELAAFEGTEFENPDYLANGPDRCFHCKADLFAHMRRIAAERGISALLYGANADDASDYRPGRKAALDHGVHAPLAEAGLSKAEVRALSRALRLPTWDKPAMPCLSSRIPYGTPVTPERLSAVEAGEAMLRGAGFRECRLRHEGDTARIEIPLENLGLLASPEKTRGLVSGLKGLGFRRVVLDLDGFRSGSLNEALEPEMRSRHSREAAEAACFQPGRDAGPLPAPA